MAKTVAEIDGDSSGLVGALDKGAQGMVKLGAQGKKLTDQLREVADQADVAAGNIISKIGGPGAITAIGGIGIAFAGVGKALDAVGASMDSFYNAQGDKGAAAMASITQAMDDLKGSLFTAVVGTDDLDEATATVIATLRIAKDVFELLLTPISSVTEAIRLSSDAYVTLGITAAEAIKQEKLFKEQVDFVTTANRLNKESVDQLIESLKTALFTKQQIVIMSQQEQLANIDAGIASIEQGARNRAAVEGEIAMARKRDEMMGPMIERIAAAHRKGVEESGYFITMQEARQRAIISIEKDGKFMAKVHEAENEVYAKAIAERTQLTAVEMQQRDTLLDARANREQEFAEQNLLATEGAPASNKPKTGSGGPAKPTETAEEKEARELKAINDLRLANTKGEQQLELEQMKWDDEQRDAKFEKEKAAMERVTAFAQQMEDEAAAERKAKGILTAEEEDALYQERKAKALAYVQGLAGQEIGVYMQNAAKQLAIGKLSAKAASDMARSALGNMIIGQGDKAMVEAGIMAAALNPLAIPMAAAGLAAYAVGNAMMPTVKPTAGSTPATEKPTDSGQAASNNYSFNMRVDSVFADGESVARQFAMMQESARARGLLMQGA
jgi:molybdate-binding protein